MKLTHTFAQEQVLKGMAVAPGIAIAPAFTYVKDHFKVETRTLSASEIEEQRARFEEAVAQSEKELRKISRVAREKIGPQSEQIFEAQALMLRDPELYDAVVARIQANRWTAGFAVESVMQAYRARLEQSRSPYLRERAHDLADVQNRIIRNLHREKALSHIEQDRVVFAANLTAADLILFSRQDVRGCAVEHGGTTSHVAIMARALGIPAVMGIRHLPPYIDPGQTVILDGLAGDVILNPTPETMDRYRERAARYMDILGEHVGLAPLPAQTLDGHHISLLANIDLDEEIDLMAVSGAQGVGLYRTEMLYLAHGRFPSEQEQFTAYKDIVERVSPQPVTFRIFDLGGDKMLSLGDPEANPFLGWRGIRMMLDRPDVLRPQLRALLRASAFGEVRVMLPMVSTYAEWDRFKSLWQTVQAELAAEDISFDPKVLLGMMIEVPSAALLADRFAPEVDFFSIGTNDLTQYVLAVDRGNDRVSDLYEELHPALLMLIEYVVKAARPHQVGVSVCGEMAGRPKAVPILLGLGVDTLSASPFYLPEVKRVIRAIHMAEAVTLSSFACKEKDALRIHDTLDQWLRAHHCGVLQRLV